jgi:acetyl/propionyl-CoA carboxylase alpha subunit
VAGLPNNIDFLIKVVRHPGFQKEQPTTAFFSKYMSGILSSLNPAPLATLPSHSLFGAVCYLQSLQEEAQGGLMDGSGEFANWRGHNQRSVRRSLKLKDAKDTVEVHTEAFHGGQYRLSHGAKEVTSLHRNCELKSVSLLREAVSDRNLHCRVLEAVVEIDGVRVSGTAAVLKQLDGSVSVDVWLNGQTGDAPTHYQFGVVNPAEGSKQAGGNANPVLTSPMPGKIVKVLVAEGAEVKEGQPVVILEAMKMEHVVHAPSDG